MVFRKLLCMSIGWSLQVAAQIPKPLALRDLHQPILDIYYFLEISKKPVNIR